MSKILEVKDLQIDFATYAGPVHAIRNVSFDLNKGETLAIVGESGSGKSVTVRTVMGLLAPNAKITNGEVLFDGGDILKKSEKQLNAMRGNDVAMIFQDPMTSLDPTMTIGKQVAEPLLLHNKMSKADALKEAERVLELVGIKGAGSRLKDYPHQFSGGQRRVPEPASRPMSTISASLPGLPIGWQSCTRVRLSNTAPLTKSFTTRSIHILGDCWRQCRP